MAYDRSQPWIKRVFTGRNGFIMAAAALAFISLNIYRFNDPLPVGSEAPDFPLFNAEGARFLRSEIKTPLVLVFYKKHVMFSNYMYNATYRKKLPEFKLLQDNNYARVIVLTEGYDTPEKLRGLSNDKEHEVLKSIGYAADTKKAAKAFGVRSWPHLFVLNAEGKIVYEAKLAGADHIQKILWRE